MVLFKRRSSLLEVQNRSLITTARERSGRIDELERELQATRQRAEQTDKLERELQTARERAERIDQLERDLQQASHEVERLTLERDFYSKRVLELEEQNRQLTEAATNYSLQGQKRERELAKIDPDGAPARRFEAFQTKGPTES